MGLSIVFSCTFFHFSPSNCGFFRIFNYLLKAYYTIFSLANAIRCAYPILTYMQFQVKVDMGEPILKASDVPTRLTPTSDQSVVKADIEVDGVAWSVTCVSMGNPHCVTFGNKTEQVFV